MSGGTVYEDYNGGDIMLENRDLIMTTTEHTINDALAAALRGNRHTWRDSRVWSVGAFRYVEGQL